MMRLEALRSYYCHKVIPLVYDESLSYYEQICKLYDYGNKIYDEIGELWKAIAEIVNGTDPQTGVTFMNFEMFGAKGDGITDDSDSILTCFEKANLAGCPVICPGGRKYKVGAMNCVIDVPFNANNSVFILPPSGVVFTTKRGEEYACASDTISTFSCGSNPTENSYFTIETDFDLGKRLDFDLYYKYKQCMCTDMHNNFSNTNWYQDFVSGHSWKLLNVMPVQTEIKIQNIIIECPNRTFPIFFKCYRNNVTVENILVTEGINSSSGAELLFFQDTGNIRIVNVTNDNIQDNNESYGYLIGVSYCTDVTIEGVKAINGWGVIGTHFISNFTFRHCNVNRIDNHYGWFGYVNIENCNILDRYKNQGFISIGFGYGQYNIRNVNITKNANSVEDYFRFRADLPLFFDGTLNIENVILDGTKSLVYLFRSVNSHSIPTWAKQGVLQMRFKDVMINCKTKKLIDIRDSKPFYDMLEIYLDNVRFKCGETNYILDLTENMTCRKLIVSNCVCDEQASGNQQSLIGSGKVTMFSNCVLNIDPYNDFKDADDCVIIGCVAKAFRGGMNAKRSVFCNNVVAKETNPYFGSDCTHGCFVGNVNTLATGDVAKNWRASYKPE